MQKLHSTPLAVASDGSTALSEAQIVAVSTEDGQPVDAETQAKISHWVTQANQSTNAARQLLQQQQAAVIFFMSILKALGDRWELGDLDKQVPMLRKLSASLTNVQQYKHLKANGSLKPTEDAVRASATTREGRVQFAWSSLLVGINHATGGITDLYATIMLWVPMLLMANATKDDADA